MNNFVRIFLDKSLQQTALDVVFFIAQQLSSPKKINDIAIRAATQADTAIQRRSPVHIGQDHLGLALLFGQLDRCFPNADWDSIAHQHLEIALWTLESSPAFQTNSSLFGGLAGLCFTGSYLSYAGTRYQRLLGTLDTLLFRRTIELLRHTNSLAKGVSFADYDLINGPSGIGAYLLLRRDVLGTEIDSTLKVILDRLVSLTEKRDGYMGFFCPAEKFVNKEHAKFYPQGAIDCGLAHGVPGPLALLSLVLTAQIKYPNLETAIRQLSEWLVTHSYHDNCGINWPYAVMPDEHRSFAGSTRAAWCYGSPGVSRALWLAGKALQATDFQGIAVDAMQAVYRRPVTMRAIPSPILCHGIAGLLQITARFANDSEKEKDAFADMVIELTKQLLDHFDPASLLGFQHIEFDGSLIDYPGFLNGATGIALALLAVATNEEPVWDRMLLLS